MNSVASARLFDAKTEAVPIVGHLRPQVSSRRRAHVAVLAERLLAEERHLATIPWIQVDVATGLATGPTLALEDHSAIQLSREYESDRSLGYRAILLAGDGDSVALARPRNTAFEGYCSDVLGLGSIDVLVPEHVKPAVPLAVACAEDRQLLSRIAAGARENGSLTLLPYMTTGGVWRLAEAIAAKSGALVRVASPPPNVARAANDKVWFARTAAELLGKDSVPPNYSAHGVAALIGHLRRLARSHRSLAIKLTHSACSHGNLVFDSCEIAGASAINLNKQIQAWMAAKGWSQSFPVQVCAWERSLISSPSVQLWIPLPSEGDPIIEGVFDQIVSGSEARFSGARPSALSPEWQAHIAEEALLLGLLLQMLGWFGRCSFDAILVDGAGHHGSVHWVECNGRWGGVSIPMTLANRLLGDWRTSEMLIVSQRRANGRGMATALFLKKFAAELFGVGQRCKGAVLLSPTQLESGTGIDLLVFDTDRHEALARANSIMSRLAQ